MRFSFGAFKLKQYLILEVARAFLGSLFFFVFVFLLFQALRLADFFILHNTPISMLVSSVGSLVVSFLPLSISVALLLGIIAAVGRLSSDSEIVAMQAAGMAPAHMIYPVVIFGLSVGAVIWLLFTAPVPDADYRFRVQLAQMAERKVTGTLKAGAFTSGFFDLLVFVDRVDPQTQRLQKVFLFDGREPTRPVVVVAQEGRVLPVRAQTSLGAAAQLMLRDGSVHSASWISEQYDVLHFEEYGIFMESSDSFRGVGRRPSTLTTAELRIAMDDQSKASGVKLGLYTEWWRRIALAFSAVAFSIFGSSFLSNRSRNVRTSALLVTVGMMSVYWIVLVWGTGLSNAGSVPSWIALNLGNFAVLGAAGFRLRKVFA